jgi:hypothetical protein
LVCSSLWVGVVLIGLAGFIAKILLYRNSPYSLYRIKNNKEIESLKHTPKNNNKELEII